MRLAEGVGTALVCPLGWGLGHASRVIPIIHSLQLKGWRVIAAGNTRTIALISSEVPSVETILFPSLQVKLYSGIIQKMNLMLIALRLLVWTQREHMALQGLIREYGISLVISDNRYGLYARSIPTVLITHLLNLKLPNPFGWCRPIARQYVAWHAKRFTECWVPDNPEGIGVSGSLSQNRCGVNNVKRVGLLSRFNTMDVSSGNQEWDLVGVVSGPEPQRTRLEQGIVRVAKANSLKTLIVRGCPDENEGFSTSGLITYCSHLTSRNLAGALLSTKYIVCRSGYSTIMDLIALKRTALLVPTPGQTEQEYLAGHLMSIGLFRFCRQKDIDRVGLEDLDKANGDLPENVGVFYQGNPL